MNMDLSTLPPELLIHVLSYLELPSLILIPLLSKAFHQFFTEAQNEVVIWCNACVLHSVIYTSSKDGSTSEPPRREWGRWRNWKANFVAGSPTEVDWTQVFELYGDESFNGTDIFPDKADWKALIQRRVEMHRSWCGELPSSITRYRADEVVFSERNIWSHMAKFQHAFDVAEQWRVNHNGVSDAAMTALSTRDTLHESTSARGVMDRIKAFLRIGVELTLLEEKAMMAATGLTLERFRDNSMVSVIGMMVPSVRNVRRIKVDERNGFFLTTQIDGGLIVSDISTSQMLWCTPRNWSMTKVMRSFPALTDRKKCGGVALSQAPPGSARIPATHTPDLHQRVASALANGDDDEFLRSIIDPVILADTTPPDFITPILTTRRQIRKQEGQGIGILDATMLAIAFSTNSPASELVYDKMGWITLFDLCQVTGIDSEKYFPQQREDEDDDNDKRLSAFFEPHLIIPVSMRGQAGSQTPDPTSHSRSV
ncbi:hypothetical protein D9611_011313 [Ephemerocybe angulata]|uniref:F-box domain-containing protein n=1 Tax=Ephemerocybe angulata TaxID=980116 RepID=A0A8H5F1M5_9AGAR|nr:hypothetical protein D9611_011313 [Tulosesus angulatus]